MIRHVVMWVFPEESGGRTRAENIRRAVELLEGLPGVVPGLRRFEVGVDELGGGKSAHLVLLSELDDWDALRAYDAHPAHREVVEFFAGVGPTRWAVDYEVPARERSDSPARG